MLRPCTTKLIRNRSIALLRHLPYPAQGWLLLQRENQLRRSKLAIWATTVFTATAKSSDSAVVSTSTRSASCTRTRTPVISHLDLGSPPNSSAKTASARAIVAQDRIQQQIPKSVADIHPKRLPREHTPSCHSVRCDGATASAKCEFEPSDVVCRYLLFFFTRSHVIEMVSFASHEQVQQKTVEHVPQIFKETAESMRLASHEKVQQRNVVGSFPLLHEFAAPVYNQAHQEQIDHIAPAPATSCAGSCSNAYLSVGVPSWRYGLRQCLWPLRNHQTRLWGPRVHDPRLVLAREPQ